MIHQIIKEEGSYYIVVFAAESDMLQRLIGGIERSKGFGNGQLRLQDQKLFFEGNHHDRGLFCAKLLS